MNRCILGDINEKTYILAKSPKVHKGGGSTPPPIGGYQIYCVYNFHTHTHIYIYTFIFTYICGKKSVETVSCVIFSSWIFFREFRKEKTGAL